MSTSPGTARLILEVFVGMSALVWAARNEIAGAPVLSNDNLSRPHSNGEAPGCSGWPSVSSALERQSKAEADQESARATVLNTTPGGTAGNPSGDAATSKRDRQVRWNSCDLKEQAQYEHLFPRLTAHRVDKLQ